MTGTLIRVFGVLLMLSALAVPLMRAPDRDVQTLVARWAPAPSEFMDLQGQLVHYRDEGPPDDPLPILLLHGTSASLHTWDGWARALRGKRRVIRFDLPGFGLTGPYSGKYANLAYTAVNDTQFAIDVLDALKVQRFVVVGNSLGGEVAWRLAAAAPQRVDRLVLVDAAGYTFDTGSLPLGWRLARLPGVNRLMEHLLPRPLVVSGLIDVYADPKRISEELVDRYFELTLREGNRKALGQRLRQYELGAGAAQIATLKLPTLILWGGLDHLIPPSHAEHFHRDIAGSRLRIFDTLGHVPHEEDPATTVAPVLEFLNPKP